jgi:hypothetical protein
MPAGRLTPAAAITCLTRRHAVVRLHGHSRAWTRHTSRCRPRNPKARSNSPTSAAGSGTWRTTPRRRRYLDLGDFREALDHAPPRIIDERSWAYWNAMTGRYPAPPMPHRAIPA